MSHSSAALLSVSALHHSAASAPKSMAGAGAGAGGGNEGRGLLARAAGGLGGHGSSSDVRGIRTSPNPSEFLAGGPLGLTKKKEETQKVP